jgi:hypothetical protein
LKENKRSWTSEAAAAGVEPLQNVAKRVVSKRKWIIKGDILLRLL